MLREKKMKVRIQNLNTCLCKTFIYSNVKIKQNSQKFYNLYWISYYFTISQKI